MESGAIPDSNITASSWWNYNGVKHAPYMARLKRTSANENVGFWVPASVQYGKYCCSCFYLVNELHVFQNL